MLLKETFLKRAQLSYLPIVLAPIVLFAPILFTGKALYWGIPALQFIPWRLAAWTALSQGTLPFWNSFNGMGAPLLANYQLALFYPPGWILYLFQWAGGASWMAWAHTLLTVIHLIWAGIGMKRLMKGLGFGELGQIVSGMSFSLCGYLVARAGFFSMIWAGAWFPWIVMAASKIAAPIREERLPSRQRFPLDLVLCIGMLLLSGHAQLSWYILTLTTVWVLVGAWLNGGSREAISALGRWAVAGLMGALLAAIQLVPTVEYLLQSQRASAVDYETALSYSFWPWRFLTLFAPDFFGNPGMGDYWGYGNFWEDAIYIGILPLLLALISLTGLFRKPGKEVWKYRPLLLFCWGAVVLAILFGMGKNTPIFPYLYENLPTFDMFNAPTRYMIWLEFSLTLLAGIAAEIFWRRPEGKWVYWARLGTAGTAAVTIGAFLAWELTGDISPSFIRSTAVAGLWSLGAGLLTLFMPDKGRHQSWSRWLVLVVFLIGMDILYSSWWINPSIQSSFYEENMVNLAAEKELLGQHRLYLSPQDEYEIKYNRFLRFQDFYPIEDLLNLRRVILPNLNLLDDISTVNNFDPFVPARFATVMDYVDTLPPDQKANWLKWMDVSLWEGADINLPLGVNFSPLEADGRVRWINCAEAAEKPSEALNLLRKRLDTDVEKDLTVGRVVLEGVKTKPDTDCSLSIQDQVKLDWTQDKPGQLRIDAQTDKEGYLLFAETWYPGWKAKLDGLSTELYRADYLFQAVAVPAGTHRVEFVYQPFSFYIGLGLSSISWLLLILWGRKHKLICS